MYNFQVVETFLAGPLNVISGVNDLRFVQVGSRDMLYAATRVGGGLAAIELKDGHMSLTASRGINVSGQMPVEAGLNHYRFNGADHLVVAGSNQGGFLSFVLSADGNFGAVVKPEGSLAGVVSAQDVFEIGNRSFIAQAMANQSSLHLSELLPDGSMAARGKVIELGQAGQAVDVPAIAAVQVGANHFVLALSKSLSELVALRVDASGRWQKTSSFGAADGLGISGPEDLTLVKVAGKTYAIVAAPGSSSLSVLELSSGGKLTLRDHLIDTLDTRFQGVSTVTSLSVNGRGFVFAGGGDGGLHVFVVLPGGQLVDAGMILQTEGLALEKISALTARVVAGKIELAVGVEGRGITRLSLDPGKITGARQGSEAADSLSGGDAADILLGHGGNDQLFGGAGNDILVDGAGQDNLWGGAGADHFVLVADGSIDRIRDFQPGLDRIDLSAWNGVRALAGLTFTSTAYGARLSFGSEVLEIHSANRLPLQLWQIAEAMPFALSRLLPQRQIVNGNYVGTDAADLIMGSARNDRFIAGLGFDTIHGGAGFDIVSFAALAQGVVVDLLKPALNAGGAAGQLFVDIEGLEGTPFSDSLSGDNGNNLLSGGGGADRLTGKGGQDSLYGGGGNDRLSGGAGADLLVGGNGNDSASYSSAKTGVVVDLGHPQRNKGEATGDRYQSIEWIQGSDHADRLAGSNAANRIWGAAGNDRIEGRGSRDRLFGGEGHDSLYGGPQDDRLFGGSGADQLFGGAGDDTLEGGPGPDLLDGGGGRNLVHYYNARGAVAVWLDAPRRNKGEAAGDSYVNIQSLGGSTHSDSLTGDRFANKLIGYKGGDFLAGGGGNDSLFGGKGKDTLWGGTGTDQLRGGEGADLFEITAGRNVILDFKPKLDRLSFDADLLPVGITTVAELLASPHVSSGAEGAVISLAGGVVIELDGLLRFDRIIDDIILL